MREIKFRAWKEDEGLMLDWSTMRQTAFNLGCTNPLFYNVFNNPNYVLMQFTGLKDRNGREIYEGDVLRFDVREGRRNLEPAMANQKGAVTITPYGANMGTWDAAYCSNIQVIGNIFENPELLEVEK